MKKDKNTSKVNENCGCENDTQKCNCQDGACQCGETCKCDSNCKCHLNTKNDDALSEIEKAKNEYENQLKIANDKINELTLEVIKLKQEILKSQDEYKKRLEQKAEEANKQVAEKRQELENRLADEIEAKKQKLISDGMQQLFTTIDQFENVVNAPCSDPQVSAYVSGFKMLLSLFEQSLNNLGITRIIVQKGDKFNDDFMSAIDAVESNEFSSGTVTSVLSSAYIYNEKVVKHAVVVVSK